MALLEVIESYVATCLKLLDGTKQHMPPFFHYRSQNSTQRSPDSFKDSYNWKRCFRLASPAVLAWNDGCCNLNMNKGAQVGPSV